MIGRTESGFEFDVDDKSLDDYELLEDLAEIADGNEGKVVSVFTRLLGSEQKNKLKEHVRNDAGKVSASGMTKELLNIFNILKGKN